jgi:hypothetical protein
MLPAILKSGASDNYLIDWFSELAIFFGIAMMPVLRSTLRLPATPNVILLGLVGIVLPLQTAGAGLLPDRGAIEVQQRALDAIVDRIRQAKRPVISDDATLLIRAGQSMRWEPSAGNGTASPPAFELGIGPCSIRGKAGTASGRASRVLRSTPSLMRQDSSWRGPACMQTFSRKAR